MTECVVICGGGTGGHINPGLAVAKELRDMKIDVSWLGIAGGLEQKLVPAAGITLHTVDYKMPGNGLFGKLQGLVGLLLPAIKARSLLKKLNAKVVLGLGGYPSLPGTVASLGCKAHMMIHEQNAVPGLANRLLAPFAHVLLTSYQQTFKERNPVVTGNPIRVEFSEHKSPAQRFENRTGKLQLLVLGGSQGAKSINDALPIALSKQSDKWDVAHATGEKDVMRVTDAYKKINVNAEVASYFNDIADKMANVDLVICRSGASTVAELSSIGAASVLVPYPHADAHQKANATPLEQEGAAKICADESLAKEGVLISVLNTLADRNLLLKMATKAHRESDVSAAKTVANKCIEQLKNV